MTKQKLWDKWYQKICDFALSMDAEYPSDMRLEFLSDVRELIQKHQQPYKNALDNIAFELNNLTEQEVEDADSQAKKLR